MYNQRNFKLRQICNGTVGRASGLQIVSHCLGLPVTLDLPCSVGGGTSPVAGYICDRIFENPPYGIFCEN